MTRRSTTFDNYSYVDANVAYPDPVTGKSRELDLFAMTTERARAEEYDFVFLVLLIECINNPQPMAFFTRERLVDPFFEVDQVKLAGLPVKIAETDKRDEWSALPNWLKMERYHHYFRGRVATQFCSFTKKREKDAGWMASHVEDQFDAFRKLCVAVDHHRKSHFESWTLGRHESINIEIYYPVLVVQGGLLEIRPRSKGSFATTSTNHVRFRQSLWSGSEAEDYSIDASTEKYLPRFVRMVRNEVARTARLLRRGHDDVRRSIKKIAREGRGLRSPKKIRRLLEF